MLTPSPKKITEKEYWASRKGQKKLDSLNKRIIEDGLKPMSTTFVTQKEFLRNAIDESVSHVTSMEDLQRLLKEKYKIDMIEKRGRLSFHLPNREKNIFERSLGTNYRKANIEKCLKGNEKIQEATISAKTIFPEDTDKEILHIIFMKSNLRLVVDLQTCVKAQQSEAYARKVKLSNLKEMSKTIAYVHEKGFDSIEDLQDKYSEIAHKVTKAHYNLKDTNTLLRDIDKQIHYTGQYLAGKKRYNEMLHSPNKGQFYQEHRNEIQAYETAARWLKEHYTQETFPSLKSLKAEKEKLLLKKEQQLELYQYFKDYKSELQIVRSNVNIMLDRPKEKQRDHELCI